MYQMQQQQQQQQQQQVFGLCARWRHGCLCLQPWRRRIEAHA
jgi:hypothetical protein